MKYLFRTFIRAGGSHMIGITRDNDQLGVRNLFLCFADRFHGLEGAAIGRDNQGRSLDRGRISNTRNWSSDPVIPRQD